MVNFPNSFDDDTTLYVAVNNLRTRLSASINDSVTTIPVVTTSGYPTVGYISILTGSDITRTEAISYTNITATDFTGAVRGASGTPTAEHNAGDNVDLTIVAAHHNELKDAILNLEHFVGVSGLENFVPQDDFGNVGITGDASFAQDVVITGTLRVEDDAYFAQNVTVTGTLDVHDDADFKEDVTVTGVVQVGTPEFSTDPQFIFVSDETITNITGVTTSTTGTGLVTPALPSGENVLFYRMNSGDQSGTTGSLELSCEFNSSTVGWNRSPGPTTYDVHYGGTDISGFKVVDGDGIATAELLYQKFTGGAGDSFILGTQGMLSIPLEQMGLVSGTEYFYTNGSDAAQIETTNGPHELTGSTMNFSVVHSGEYLMICSAEAAAGLECRVNYRLNSVNQNTGSETGTNLNYYTSNPFIKQVYLAAGANTAEVYFLLNTVFGNSGGVKRGRMLFIRKAAFENIVVDRSSSDQNTSSNSFVEYLPTTQTYSPKQREQVLVLGQACSYTAGKTSWATYKLYNSTTNTDYMVDAGNPNFLEFGDLGVSTPGLLKSFFFFQVVDSHLPEEWQLQFREASGNAALQTVTEGTLVLWGNTLDPGDVPPTIDFTLINDAGVTATNVEADYMVANYGLTISGFAVATGTSIPPADHSALSNLDYASAGHTGFASTADTDALAASGVATDAQVTANQAEFLSASGTLVTKTGDTMTGELMGTIGTYSESLTISGEPVATGTGGGGVSDHSLLSNLDYASAGHTGFAQVLTVKESDDIPTVSDVNTIIVDAGSLTDEGGGQVRLTTSGTVGEEIIVVTGTFTQSLTISGVPVSTGTAGISDHASLSNLDYASAGHTGFTSDVNSVTDSIVIDGSGGIAVNTASQTITIDGSGIEGGGTTTSGLYFNTSAKPVNPSPWSDFFDDNSSNPTLSGYHWIDWDKWSLWDVDTVSGSTMGRTERSFCGPGDAWDMNHMIVHHDATTQNGWVGFYQDVPSGDFTITTKVGHGSYSSNTNYRIGIFVADDLDAAPATADLFSCHLHMLNGIAKSADYSQYQATNWSDYNSISSDYETNAAPWPGMSVWLKIRYYSGTTLEAAISNDGITFTELYRNASLSFTPNKLGFGIEAGGGGITASFEFVSIINQAIRERPAGHGRLVPVVIS